MTSPQRWFTARLCLSLAGALVASSATRAQVWTGAVNSSWTNPANWTNGIVPNSSSAVATFDEGAASVSLPSNVTVKALDFSETEVSHVLNMDYAQTLTLDGIGIIGPTASASQLINNLTTAGNIVFLGAATISRPNPAASITLANGGTITFADTSSAGSATINSQGYGRVNFTGNSTADSATITGAVYFADHASAGTATFSNAGGDFAGNSNAGSATFNGDYYLRFFDTASAGSATIGIQQNRSISFWDDTTAESATFTVDGSLNFYGNASAGQATIVNSSTGQVGFSGNSSAGEATITNHYSLGFGGFASAGSATILNEKWLDFSQSSDAANAAVTNTATGTLVITVSQFSLGSLAGSGITYLYASGTFEVGNLNTDTTYSGSIGGSGTTFIKVGTGTLTLAGDTLSFGGLIEVQAGTLQFARTSAYYGGRTDSSWGPFMSVQAGAMAAFNAGGAGEFSPGEVVTLGNYANFAAGSFLGVDTTNAAEGDVTLSNPLTGAFGLRKLGSGTLTLASDNTYPGITTVAAGTLRLAGAGRLSDSTALTINNGATFDLNGVTDTVGTLSGSGNLTLGAGALTTIMGSAETFSGVISGSGAFTKDGGSTLTLSGNNTYTGATTIAAGTLTLAEAGRLSTSTSVTIASGATLSVANADHTLASLAGAGNVDLGSRVLTTGGNDASTTFSGVASGTGGLTKTGTGTLTLAGDNTYTGATTISAGTLALGNGGNAGSVAGDIVNNAALILNRANDATYAGEISCSGSVTKSGAGTFTLTGNNTYTGATTISAGTLALADDGRLNAATPVTVASGAMFSSTSADRTIGSLAGAGNVALGSRVLTTGGNDASTTFSGVASGTGGLTKVGTGTFTLTGNNTYSGTTTISAGTLQLGSGGTTGSVAGDIINNAAFILNRANDVTSTGVISGSGSVTKNGAGTWTLTNLTSYTGATTINVGTLEFAGDANLYVNGLHTGDITVNSGGTLRLARNYIFGNWGDTTTPALTINAGGLVTNTGTTTMLADLTLAGGTLEAQGGASPGFPAYFLRGIVTATGNIASQITAPGGTNSLHQIQLGDNTDGGATTFNVTHAEGLLTISAALEDGINLAGSALTPSGLVKTGAGTLVLSADNTYSGTTTVSAGTLQIGAGGTSGSVTGNIVNHAALVLDRSDDVVFDGVISGSGSVTKNGAGILTLTAANSYTGTTTINAGVLNFAGDNYAYLDGKLTGAINVNDGGTLRFNRNLSFGGFDVTSTPSITVNAGGVVDNGSTFNTLVNLTLAGGTLAARGGAGPGYHAYHLKGTVTASGAVVSQITAPGDINSFHQVQIGDHTAGGTTTFHVADAAGSLAIDAALIDGLNSAATAYTASGLVKTGPGTLTLTGANSYAGGTTVSAGTLVGNATSLQGNITNDAAITFEQASAGTYAGSLSGTGTLTKNGAGTLTLAGANTFTGDTTIAAGTLELGHSLALQNSVVHLSDGGTLSFGTLTAVSLGGLPSNWSLALNNGSSPLALTLGSSADSTYNGVLSGTGSLTKVGSGTLTLTGANTYTGGTTVSGGWLAGDTTNLRGTITNNAGLRFNQDTDAAFNGMLSGVGGFTKAGAGTLTLTGQINQAAVAIEQGTLHVSGDVSLGSVSVGQSGILAVSQGGVSLSTLQTYESATVAVSGGTLSLSELTVAGSGTAQLNLSGGTVNASGTTLLGAYGDSAHATVSGGTLNTGDFYVGYGAYGRLTQTAGTIAVSGNSYIGYWAESLESEVLVSGGTWTTAGNLYMGELGAASLTITGGTVRAGFIDMTATDYGPNRLSLGGTGVLETSRIITDNPLTLTGGTLRATADTAFSDNTLVLQSGVATIDSQGFSLHFNRALTGDGGLTKAGSGQLLLSGNNSYTGGTSINGGTLAVGADAHLGGAAGTIAFAGGTLRTTGTFTASRATTLDAGGGTFDVATGTTLTWNGNITGDAEHHLNKTGDGALVLGGDNSYSGGTNVNQGVLRLGSATALSPNTTLHVAAGASFDANGFAQTFTGLSGSGTIETGSAGVTVQTSATPTIFEGTLTGSGSVTVSGSGKLTIASSGHTYTGETTVSGGTLKITGDISSSALTAVSNRGVLAGTGTVGVLSLANGGTLAPGSSPGTLNAGDTTFGEGGYYAWEINDAQGSAGTNWDLLNVTGTLTFSATTENPFTISLLTLTAGNDSGPLFNFNSGLSHAYTIATASGGIFGFNPNAITLNLAGFENSLDGGAWSVAQAGNNVNLVFTSTIPEPSTYAALFGAAVLGLATWKRRRRTP
ncbi:MAG: autotransporter-associated beta strand repeat-containing protein [Candidatus Didemnitutus sp.]|nr:autotransporter-associated beta strand repeat-containing protein [Candidatus Didemnitutus sp.]